MSSRSCAHAAVVTPIPRLNRNHTHTLPALCFKLRRQLYPSLPRCIDRLAEQFPLDLQADEGWLRRPKHDRPDGLAVTPVLVGILVLHHAPGKGNDSSFFKLIGFFIPYP